MGQQYFHNPDTGEYHLVDMLPKDTASLEDGYYYVIGEHVYPYVGKLSTLLQFRKNWTGGIASIGGKSEFQEWETETEKEIHSIAHLVDEDRSSDIMKMKSVAEMIDDYVDAWQDGRNLATMIRNHSTSSGDIYIPKFRDEDCPLERILKRMIISMKIVSSEERKKMSDDYKYDNMVSSLDGATKHMSIIKFLEWTVLLELDWEFSVFDLDDNAPYPLKQVITISNHDDGFVDIVPPDDKAYFMVPCIKGEDPYKRLIKLSLWTKYVPTAVYRKKGSTDHQINNMKSALKSQQKMRSDYFATWCELLSMGYSFTLTNRKGIWFKAIGYDITTNYEEEINAGTV